ncbi:hypothetical protein [Bacteroides fragilis]|uniref:hypothetical protein n=1 Tax=Bacteroides fragilis TaxID=817 RepID=UPI00202DC40E|nr:hypothetical protein [Bacteroides fragilis]MCM0314264.1 hypothetical protein [Bacteroides fragilis]
MIFAPHILYVRLDSKVEYDKDGNPITLQDETWKEVGECRCDDNGTARQISVGGQLFDFSYHIVYTGGNIAPDTEVKVLDDDGAIRGKGIVKRCSVNNYLNYSQIWI